MPGSVGSWVNQRTFSVGIFQWIPKRGGKDLKKSAVKFRVIGDVQAKDDVLRYAEVLCYKMDEGWEPDTKTQRYVSLY
ncbi:MAG: hypothetical protein ABFD89_30160 [Bryobacteraceae bacterium]